MTKSLAAATILLALAVPASAQQQTPPTTEQQDLVPPDARDGVAGQPGEMATTGTAPLADCHVNAVSAIDADAVVMETPAEEAARTEDEDGVEIVAESADVQIEAVGVEEMEEQAEALQETEALEETDLAVAAAPC